MLCTSSGYFMYLCTVVQNNIKFEARGLMFPCNVNILPHNMVYGGLLATGGKHYHLCLCRYRPKVISQMFVFWLHTSFLFLCMRVISVQKAMFIVWELDIAATTLGEPYSYVHVITFLRKLAVLLQCEMAALYTRWKRYLKVDKWLPVTKQGMQHQFWSFFFSIYMPWIKYLTLDQPRGNTKFHVTSIQLSTCQAYHSSHRVVCHSIVAYSAYSYSGEIISG